MMVGFTMMGKLLIEHPLITPVTPYISVKRAFIENLWSCMRS
ncbi:hypothetical protein BTN49_2818 [Candidatus Enterovibrio escicola]|uniref:Uncharacterized protein n=1 Tax=Candidatus Enterovibrio escicola TaxID=1927127 RepID=A0A2A5T065_9GAMM|nr:hypothetical protein BTN49_2818 [Candidatus Enterovibrio escacola]